MVKVRDFHLQIFNEHLEPNMKLGSREAGFASEIGLRLGAPVAPMRFLREEIEFQII